MTDKKKYNIIMILLDGARYDRVKNLNALGKWGGKGTLFSTAITYGPQTVTALHSLFSGIYGNRNGADNYFGALNFKKKLCKTMAEYLKGAGYSTQADILQDIILPKQGFDDITIHDENKDDILERHPLIIKEKNLLRKKGQNFFLFLQYSPIHTGMIRNVVKKYDYDDFNKEYFGNQATNLKNYDLYIEKATEYLDKIFNLAENLHLFKDTLFIIFSDHGSSTGEKIGELGYGRYCYDYTIKSFMTFIQPEIFPKKEIKKLCRLIDIFPTILEILNISPDKRFMKLQGKSVLSLLDKEPDSRVAFSEASGREQKPTNRRPYVKSVRDKRWKLIYNTDSSVFELYDLKTDPKEEKNLAGKKLEKLREMLEKLLILSPEIENLNVLGKINLSKTS